MPDHDTHCVDSEGCAGQLIKMAGKLNGLYAKKKTKTQRHLFWSKSTFCPTTLESIRGENLAFLPGSKPTGLVAVLCIYVSATISRWRHLMLLLGK